MPRPSRRQTSAKIRLENQEKNNPGSGVYLKGSNYTRRADSGTDSEWVESGSDVDHEDTEPESDDAEYDEDDDMDPVQVFLLRLQHEEANPTPTKHWQGNGNSKRNKRRRRQQERQKEAREKDPEWRRKKLLLFSSQVFQRARRNTTLEMAAMATVRAPLRLPPPWSATRHPEQPPQSHNRMTIVSRASESCGVDSGCCDTCSTAWHAASSRRRAARQARRNAACHHSSVGNTGSTPPPTLATHPGHRPRP